MDRAVPRGGARVHRESHGAVDAAADAFGRRGRGEEPAGRPAACGDGRGGRRGVRRRRFDFNRDAVAAVHSRTRVVPETMRVRQRGERFPRRVRDRVARPGRRAVDARAQEDGTSTVARARRRRRLRRRGDRRERTSPPPPPQHNRDRERLGGRRRRRQRRRVGRRERRRIPPGLRRRRLRRRPQDRGRERNRRRAVRRVSARDGRRAVESIERAPATALQFGSAMAAADERGAEDDGVASRRRGVSRVRAARA
mmetsp:Transcript_11053/g.40006  ORF Transcript_11053/g.40006 Transcript_11053/m.40006 type:complete len:254 (+) Transcript_11053:894-1655(+)